ncbi:protein-disulfide reductase DsbD domain-containing protein [Tichowtungia aerotolerans]|uniref:Thiol:disulfide interchange protein DsbD N-terminal domain-containing protein n=1 Tax=Tichowtungia aerotolerans TaxID=2697043 RepID=A0A6P1M063_9BACT|nr:protein-disulfide reductase DsbD domain-containing protein [Tichowtungia aerotolerans]QHI67940.1 hypothetical protein GT409_00250 [Tichowtungia aerotolerans]
MRAIFQPVLFLIAALWMVGTARAEDERSSVEVFVAYKTVRPGDRLPVAVRIKVAEGWHTYAKEPGDSGMPPSIEISGVDGLEVSEWRFPAPESFTDSAGTSYGYEHQVVLLSNVLIPASVPAGETIQLTASITWMICKDICVFQKGTQTVSVQSGSASSEPTAEWQALLKESGWEKAQ